MFESSVSRSCICYCCFCCFCCCCCCCCLLQLNAAAFHFAAMICAEQILFAAAASCLLLILRNGVTMTSHCCHCCWCLPAQSVSCCCQMMNSWHFAQFSERLPQLQQSKMPSISSLPLQLFPQLLCLAASRTVPTQRGLLSTQQQTQTRTHTRTKHLHAFTFPLLSPFEMLDWQTQRLQLTYTDNHNLNHNAREREREIGKHTRCSTCLSQGRSCNKMCRFLQLRQLRLILICPCVDNEIKKRWIRHENWQCHHVQYNAKQLLSYQKKERL